MAAAPIGRIEKALTGFCFSFQLTRKDLLVKNLKRMKKAFEKEGRHDEAQAFDFFPQTYHMPSESSLFVRKFKELKQSGENPIWIMKPIGRAQVGSSGARFSSRGGMHAWIDGWMFILMRFVFSSPKGKGIFLVSKLSQIEAWLKER